MPPPPGSFLSIPHSKAFPLPAIRLVFPASQELSFIFSRVFAYALPSAFPTVLIPTHFSHLKVDVISSGKPSLICHLPVLGTVLAPNSLHLFLDSSCQFACLYPSKPGSSLSVVPSKGLAPVGAQGMHAKERCSIPNKHQGGRTIQDPKTGSPVFCLLRLTGRPSF